MPLFEVYFELLAQNKKVFLKGEDLLGNVLTFLNPMKYRTVAQARNKIQKNS